MASDIVASVAISLDGYIAEPDGGVDFLEKYPMEDFDFQSFIDGIGALIMGSASYEQALGWGWPWNEKPTMVLTTRGELEVAEGAQVTFSDQPTGEAIRSFAGSTHDRLWVFGGARVITDGLIAGEIDTLDLMVMPEALGGGIPLFTKPHILPMEPSESSNYANGATRLIYKAR
jgi:dihydrofolate reductase